MKLFCKHDWQIWVDLESYKIVPVCKASIWQKCKKCDTYKSHVYDQEIVIRVMPSPAEVMEQYRQRHAAAQRK